MLNIYGMQPVQFSFGASKQSSQQQTAQVNVPAGANGMQVFLTAFDVSYTDNEEYGFGRLQIAVQALSQQTVQCSVTLRDNNTDSREWQGTVTAMAIFYQGS